MINLHRFDSTIWRFGDIVSEHNVKRKQIRLHPRSSARILRESYYMGSDSMDSALMVMNIGPRGTSTLLDFHTSRLLSPAIFDELQTSAFTTSLHIDPIWSSSVYEIMHSTDKTVSEHCVGCGHDPAHAATARCISPTRPLTTHHPLHPPPLHSTRVPPPPPLTTLPVLPWPS